MGFLRPKAPPVPEKTQEEKDAEARRDAALRREEAAMEKRTNASLRRKRGRRLLMYAGSEHGVEDTTLG